ncbi:MAG: serine/threonine-protein kinase [Dokdonella sp.]
MNLPSTSLRELFETALLLEGSARSAFLDENCADAEDRKRIEGMIAADADVAEPLAEGGVDRLANAIGTTASPPHIPPGSRIGPFVLVEVLGEGGSSTVFHATRDIEGATQHVALKLMRRGLYSPDAQRLFRREQRALIQLRHPNIARMIEAGVTDEALPYIALELVTGNAITDHVRVNELNLRQRLRLFCVVCTAVDAAHRALIVHRDLKPSNVLVTDEGEVKLLDFGVAKLLTEDEEGNLTQLPAFTPAYAAPEQRNNGPITTATDVYALGVLLGELITGERVNDGSGRTPSSWITSPVGSGSTPTNSPITRRQDRGDLDAIVIKALDDDPSRRYASAGSLAEEIDRLLAGHPVSAQPPTRRYRTRKFVLRHKGGVLSTVAFLLGILAALGIAVWQAQVAREQARIAHNESTRANSTLGFITDLLKTASAELPKDQRPTPEALVQDAAKSARDDPNLDPLVRAQLLLTLGEISRTNGDNANAESLIDEAIERERELGVKADSAEWIAALVSKGNLLHSTNRSSEADRLMRDLIPGIESVDTEGAVSALMLYGVTRAYAGDAEGAAVVARQALAKAQRVFGPDSSDAIETATYLGQLCSNLGRYRESEAILEEGMARWRRLGLPLNQQYARSLFHLAVSKHRLGKLDEVEPLYRDGLALMRSVQEGPFYRLSQGLVGLALFLLETDRFDEAKRVVDEALANDQQVFGADHVRTAVTLDAQASVLGAMQQLAAAETAVHRSIDILTQHAGGETSYEPELARARLHRVRIVNALGRTGEAAALHAEAIAEISRVFKAPGTEMADALRVEGEIAINQSDFARALDSADRALALLATVDLPALPIEVATRTLRANALLALLRIDDARVEIIRAFNRLNQSNPLARAGLTHLLAVQARVEYAAHDGNAAAAALGRARVLGVPLQLLDNEDRATLQRE